MHVHYGHLVRILHWCCDQTMTEALNQMDLTASQGRLMAFVAHRGQLPTYAKDVEAELHLTHPTVSGLLSRLEQKGFVHLTTDPRDRRARIVRLDASVRHNYEPGPTLHMEERLLQGLSDEECGQLCSLLLRVYENIK